MTLANIVFFFFFFLLRGANKQEIIKAYRKLAQQWHPDNFQSESEKKEAEKKFIDIASAKEVLIDPGQELTWLLHLADTSSTSQPLGVAGERRSSRAVYVSRSHFDT